MNFFLIIFLFSIKVLPQNISDSRSNSLSSSNIADINVLSSAFNNPCGIIFQKKPVFIFNYSNYTQITELSRINFAFINSMKENNLGYGISLQRFGYYLYNENKLSIFSSKKIFENIDLGVKINFFLNQISEINKNEYFMNFDLGLNYYINKIYVFSIFFENSLHNIFFKENINESNVRIGINYIEYYFLNIFLEYQQFFHFKNEIKIGFEYKFKEIFSILSGISLLNKNIGFGLGANFFDFKFNIGVLYSSNLNANISSSLTYEL